MKLNGCCKTIYNKAVDDLYEKYYPREICNKVKELAEQLKIDKE